MAISRRLAVGAACAAALLGAVGTASAQDTLKVGLIIPMTGPIAEIGMLQAEGAKLGVEKINAAGGINGKKIELITEDDQATNPGMVLAFSKLVNRGDLVAIIGSIRSTQINAINEDGKKAAIPLFYGGTDPTLSTLGNPWFFRARPSDAYSAKVLASFGINNLQKKKWAVVHSTDSFGVNGSKALIGSLKELGVEPVVVQSFNNGQTDLTPVVLAVRQSGADIIATYVAYETDVGLLARQLRQLGVTIPWVGSPSVSATTARNLAGPALYNSYSVADFSADGNPKAKVFAEEFLARVKRQADHVSGWPYDSVFLLAEAIKKAGSTAPDKIRDALASIKGFEGVEGTYNYDKTGEGLRAYHIVRNVNGNLAFDRTIAFDK
jgi:branched-chain amino acid transport system substrate-binding protein